MNIAELNISVEGLTQDISEVKNIEGLTHLTCQWEDVSDKERLLIKKDEGNDTRKVYAEFSNDGVRADGSLELFGDSWLDVVDKFFRLRVTMSLGPVGI